MRDKLDDATYWDDNILFKVWVGGNPKRPKVKSEGRLTLELIPNPLWGINPRTAMGRRNWDKVRKETYAAWDHRCGVCGDVEPTLDTYNHLEAHEIWEYDDAAYVQKLSGLIALCSRCHGVKHLAGTVTRIRSRDGEDVAEE